METKYPFLYAHMDENVRDLRDRVAKKLSASTGAPVKSEPDEAEAGKADTHTPSEAELIQIEADKALKGLPYRWPGVEIQLTPTEYPEEVIAAREKWKKEYDAKVIGAILAIEEEDKEDKKGQLREQQFTNNEPSAKGKAKAKRKKGKGNDKGEH